MEEEALMKDGLALELEEQALWKEEQALHENKALREKNSLQGEEKQNEAGSLRETDISASGLVAAANLTLPSVRSSGPSTHLSSFPKYIFTFFKLQPSHAHLPSHLSLQLYPPIFFPQTSHSHDYGSSPGLFP